MRKGIPTLRHDWNWPIDRAAIPSFAREAFDGWLPAGLGMPNPHPTTYLISVPIASAMWLFGPLATLALLAAAIAYLCMRVVAALPSELESAGRQRQSVSVSLRSSTRGFTTKSSRGIS